MTMTEHYAAATKAMNAGQKLGQLASCRNHGARCASYINDQNRSTPYERAEIINVTKSGRIVARDIDGTEIKLRPDGKLDGRLAWTTGITHRTYGMQDSTGTGHWNIWTLATAEDTAKHEAYQAKLATERAEAEARHRAAREAAIESARPRYEQLVAVAEAMGLHLQRGFQGIEMREGDEAHEPLEDFIRYSGEGFEIKVNGKVSLPVDKLIEVVAEARLDT